MVPILLHQAWGQTPTAIDLRAQSRNVDFSSAATTRPFKSGAALPGTCTVGEMFYLTAATAGANLYGCTASNAWTIESGASGAQAASQLTDLKPALTSSTVLTIGANCSAAAPCNVRIGGVTHSVTSSTTATISAGSGTAFFYVDSDGTLTVGHSMTVNCASGCVAVPGVSAFPSDSVPLFAWTATGGTWDASGGVDWRAFQGTTSIGAGSGLLGTAANGLTTLSIDPTLIGMWVPVPANSSSTCTKGAWSLDSSFYYVCVAANTWRRTALTTW